MSDQAKLFMKIVNVMEEVGQLNKDGEVKDRSGKVMYAYLSEELTTSELQKAFIKHRLVLLPVKVESELIYLESIQHEKEVKAPITKVIVTYKIGDAETGASQELQSIGYGSDSQDKGSNKAMTGAFKYVQRQTFCISTGEDGDHTGSDQLDKLMERKRQTEAPKTAPQAAGTAPAPSAPPAPTKAPESPTSVLPLVTEGQLKMLNAKALAAGYKKEHKEDLMEAVTIIVGRPILSMNEIRRSEVDKIIKWFTDQTQTPTG